MLTNSSLHIPILVVGGAGYIGSHMTMLLHSKGFLPIVLDNLSKGHADAVSEAKLIVGDMGDTTLLRELFSTYAFKAVMHFAGFIEVGESHQYPNQYYINNVSKTLNLLEIMHEYQVNNLIFSSSAAVYGEPLYSPIDENHPLAPVSPYGRSKWMTELIIKDYANAFHLKYAILRYFNAAGSHPTQFLGERHHPESHLIPLLLQVANGEKEGIHLYGEDYPTPDGTCIRDYVHVQDLCHAHYLSLANLLSDKQHNLVCNLGAGKGYSVKEVIQHTEFITGRTIPFVSAPRRPGDPAQLVADTHYAHHLLDWQPRYSNIETIITDAWHVKRLLAS